MCRLALMDVKGIKYIEENYGLKKLFDYLERQLGGHGNGYCLIYNDGSYVINKGVTLSNQTIVDDIMAQLNNIKWVIYHTRLASIGSISNANCHPFENNGKVIAMNGTEHNYKIVDKKLTDTENILLSSKNITKDTRKYNSVFLGYENEKVFANKNCGSLQYIACDNGGKVFASSFPYYYHNYETIYEAPQNFIEGQDISNLTVAECSYYGYYEDCADRNYNHKCTIYDNYWYYGLR